MRQAEPRSPTIARRRERARSRPAALALAALALGGGVPAPVRAQHGPAALGHVDIGASCAAAVLPDLNRAVALLHHMTYPQAGQTFERVAAADPACAMAHWGVAMTLFQPVWPTRPSPADLRRGWDEVRAAQAAGPPTERERLYVAAAEAFFRDPASPDYWARIRRWEGAMDTLHRAFPDDPDATAFYALAHLAAAPADEIAGPHARRAAELLHGVLERYPDHPGAMHYLIHADDAPGRERLSLPVVAEYGRVAPRNPHALHMPTHIATRLGDWAATIDGNVLAADAALENPAGGDGSLVSDEFPHAIEYLVYACLQLGEDGAAARQIARLQATPDLQPTFKTAFHLASTQARYALERRAWADAAALVPRQPATLDWDRYRWPEAVTWFARGFGAARAGELARAREALQRLGALEAASREGGEALFARNIQVLALELRGWLAHLSGDGESGVALLREAAAVEAATPKHAVTPAPTLPADELLGDLLLERRRPAEALAAYRRALAAYPRRFNGLLGAARAARAAADERAAQGYYRDLLELVGAGARPEAVAEARRYAPEPR